MSFVYSRAVVARRRSEVARSAAKSVVVGAAIEPLERRVLMAVDVLTYHYDSARDGANTAETTLTPANVSANSFGKKFSLPVDGYVYGQPLLKTNVAVPGLGTRDVLIVVTEHDSVYAFDAHGNNPASGYLWKKSFVDASKGITTVPSADVNTTDIVPEIGITSTPVIDATTDTVYVVAKTKEVTNGVTKYVQRLHAMDVATGSEKFSGPTVISATVSGTGEGGSSVSFNALTQNQRAALLLVNGTVYITWSSHGDNGPYHGWVMGYSASNISKLVTVFNDTPNGSSGGIWMGGGGIAADSGGNIYVDVGNGTFDANTGGKDYGNSALKLSTSGGLKVSDYFTPVDQANLNAVDGDFGVADSIILPTQTGTTHTQELLTADKLGEIFLVDRNNFGKYNGTSNTNVQSFSIGSKLHNSIGYFNGTFYIGGDTLPLKAYTYKNGSITTTASSVSPDVFGNGGEDGQGTSPTFSSNGTSQGIVWALDNSAFDSSGAAVLRAYLAGNLNDELYSSSQAGNGRDTAGAAVKFTAPVVANGLVYVAGEKAVTVYGLLGAATSGRYSQVALSGNYNQQGIYNDGTKFSTSGGLDGTGNALSKQLLGSSISFAGSVYSIAAAGANNVVASTGQTINLSTGVYRSLSFLATTVHQAAVNQTFKVNYTNGTSQSFTLSLSHWQTPVNYPGESIALTMGYRDTAGGTKQSSNTPWRIYGYSLPLSSTQTVKSIALPNNSTIKIVAMDLVGGAVSVGLSTAFNAQGIASDGSTFSAANSLDKGGSSLSSAALGGVINWNGSGFVPGAADTNDIIVGKGQSVTLPTGNYSTLNFLATAYNGNQANLSFVVHYTDGTATTFSRSVSDWFAPNANAGESIALQTPYRNESNGSKDARPFYVYGYSLALNIGKKVASITLPNDANVVVLAMDLS